MDARVDIELDDHVRRLLEEEASSRGISLSMLLGELAAQAANELRRRRIRAETKRVAAYVRSSPEARAFCEFWGTPTAILD